MVTDMVSDCRNIKTGLAIPGEGYADQPYVVQTNDGAWLLVITTGKGHEGDHGQHVISMRTKDCGKTWTDIADLEPADGPEASYAVLLKTPYGRIYCFYNHNTDNVREVKVDNGDMCPRVDSLGHYVFKYSDDNGKSWSGDRYDVPVREFEIDRNNPYGGSLRFFWNVGRPLVLGDEVLLVLHKIASMDFARTEGCFIHSSNILSERDPLKIQFDTLPDGDIGLRAPNGGGSVAEEQSVNVLKDGSLVCIYRTSDGCPAVAYSRDNAHTWTEPEYLTYNPGGKHVKHPRAANFLWKCSNGQYLYWFHNHSGLQVKEDPNWNQWNDRNPAWLMAAREVDTPEGLKLEFSQPEILLYDSDPYVGISYPDLVEQSGRFWVTETQKSVGRVHEIRPEIIEGLFSQWDRADITRDALVLEHINDDAGDIDMPKLPDFNMRDHTQFDMSSKDLISGFTVECVLNMKSLSGGQIILDSRKPSGQGLCLVTTERNTLAIVLNDGRNENRWETDPGTIAPGKDCHVVFVVDGGPKIISVIVDGILCDGGEYRQFGWGRYNPNLQNVTGSKNLHLSEQVKKIRIYNRALRTSEAVANYRAESL